MVVVLEGKGRGLVVIFGEMEEFLPFPSRTTTISAFLTLKKLKTKLVVEMEETCSSPLKTKTKLLPFPSKTTTKLLSFPSRTTAKEYEVWN